MRLAASLIAFLALTGCLPPAPPVPDNLSFECGVSLSDIEDYPAEVGPADKVVADFSPDTYLLALAWQPEACRSHAADTSDPSACDRDRTWTLHGLWPNSDDGKHPRYCRASQPLDRVLVAKNYCMIPSEKLQQHEYAAHGVCAWDSPEAYFAQARALWQGLEKPALTQPTMTAGALRDAFAAANPGLPRDAVAIATGDGGRLREARICHDLQFKAASCAPKALGARDDFVLTITAPADRLTADTADR